MTTSSKRSQRKIQQQAIIWLMRIKSCDCQETEKHEFTKWLQNPEHQLAYSEVEKFWQQLDDLGSVAEQQVQAARQYYLLQRNKNKSRSHLTIFSTVFAITLAGLLVLTPQARYWIYSDYYQTVKGERRSLQLSDGSHVELNTDTQLRISYAFWQRTVWLEHGEAWFDVAHNDKQPFEVIAGEKSIRDIGTQFNVYREGKRINVAIQEGEVAIFSDHDPKILNLSAGMQTSSSDSGQFSKIETSDTITMTAWLSGLLIFKKQPLQVVLQQLNRYHNVTVSVTDPSLQTLSVSGRFPANNLNQILNTITSALPVKIVQKTPEHIIIQRQN